MKYTLITRKGKIMSFYINGMAELYQQLHGGVIITDEVFDTNEQLVPQGE